MGKDTSHFRSPTRSSRAALESWYDSGKNYFSPWSYTNPGTNNWLSDKAGNITKVGGVAKTFVYDAESRMVSTTGALTTTYSYDGEGRRVMRNTGYLTLNPTVWVYDAMGQLAAE